jgi:hypothetical protein
MDHCAHVAAFYAWQAEIALFRYRLYTRLARVDTRNASVVSTPICAVG